MLLTTILSVGFPFLALRLEKNDRLPSFFSAVVLCYAFGIIIGNLLPQLVHEQTAEQLAAVGMIIALPMLLFGANIKENWRLAGPGLLAYGLCAIAGLIGTALAAYYFQESQPDGWKVAGMLTGLYTGGTPNMQAIGIAVDAPGDYVVLLQASDIVGGGIYLLMLMTIIHPFLGRFLPSFSMDQIDKAEEASLEEANNGFRFLPTIISLGVGAAAAGLTYLLTGDIGKHTTLLILLLTTISLGLSFSPRISNLRGAYLQGEYFLLIFCVALGLMANFQKLLGEGLQLLAFSLVALISTILIHWLLAKIFKIDRDTVMISSTAALYGPVFIAQVTTAINNRRLLAPGIALSLLGLAIGNYLGIGVAYLAKWLLIQF
ncbi:DUF819 family protein [Lewinella sp. LCG006]|uniref:DUF819 family protein n=1 Tax=Lewinella sp. LCG006 TaxID=3231911 RepID=UPI0034616961